MHCLNIQGVILLAIIMKQEREKPSMGNFNDWPE